MEAARHAAEEALLDHARCGHLQCAPDLVMDRSGGMFVVFRCGFRAVAMNISLSSDLEQLVQRQVLTGRYTSASDVVGEALRQMDERDRAWTLWADDAREKIAAGMASLRAGDGLDGDAFLAAMDAELAELEGHAPA